jgi:heat-inducible transcriptional repressor
MLRQIAGMLASRTASVSIILTPGSRRRVYFWGVSYILHQPEFIDLKSFEPLMELLESEYTLAEWLTEEVSEPQVHVRIGSENRHEELSRMSLIAAGFKMDEEAPGIVGLLGPTRMDYGTAIPIVDFTARNLSRIIRDE